MATKIYVGNLPHAVDNDKLQEVFEAYGDIASATVISDRDTGRSRGFGFVEYANEAGAEAAIEAMNGQELDGRALTVNQARERTERRGGGGGGGGGRGNYGGGGGGGRRY